MSQTGTRSTGLPQSAFSNLSRGVRMVFDNVIKLMADLLRDDVDAQYARQFEAVDLGSRLDKLPAQPNAALQF